MRYSLFDGQRDIIILIARILLMILFVLSGWAKLTGFDGTVGYMTSLGALPRCWRQRLPSSWSSSSPSC